MEYIKKAESKIGEWLKPVPHLPEDWRKWLAANIWWIMVISAVLICLSMITILKLIAIEFAWSPVVQSLSNYGLGSVNYGDSNIFFLFVSLVVMAAFVSIFISAIKPLKAGEKKGWDLMFVAFLLSVAFNVFSLLGTFHNFFSALLNVAIGAFIGAYLLFELKSYFVKTAKKPKTAKK